MIITGDPKERGGDQIDPTIWATISRFKYVYLVNGSPLQQSTLEKANINYADKVIILGHDSALQPTAGDDTVDSEVIYIYKAVKQCNKDVQVITELAISNNIEFLIENDGNP